MKRYRLDAKKPRKLTAEEARRVGEAPIDHSDIPPLGDEFFTRAVRMTLRAAMERQPPLRAKATPARANREGGQ